MRHRAIQSIPFCIALTLSSGAIAATEAPTVEQLQANPALLGERFQPAQSLTVEEHYFRGELAPGESDAETAAHVHDWKDLYVVKNGAQTLYIKKRPFRHPGLSFKVIDSAGAQIACLPNPDGGNGWRVNPWFVVLRDPLKLLGQVSDVRDADDDGDEDLIVYDDIWESGLGLFSHAEAPVAEIFYRVEGEALVVDKQATEMCGHRNIARLNTEIQEALTKDAKEVPLAAILSKFLHYRAMGLTDSGWHELRKDLGAFNAKQPLAVRAIFGDRPDTTLTQEDIERRIAESLEKRGPLEKDLEAYTLEPLK